MRSTRSPRAVHNARYKHLLSKLRDARKEAGLTQTNVAKLLGKTQAWVSRCELGERRIDPIDLADFSHVYRKPFSYFIPRSDGR